VNIQVGAVRALFNWADKQGYLRRNPIAKWRSLDAPPSFRRRALTAWEIAKLLQHSPPELADAWRFVLGTGLRAGELTSLEWADVNWDEPSIQVRAETSKSKRSRVIPLRKDLVAVLRRQLERKAGRKARAERLSDLYRRRQREGGSDEAIARAGQHLKVASRAVEAAERLAFTNSAGGHWGKELTRRLKSCLKAAGLSTDIDVHTLRHTFGSHLVAGGWDVKTVQELMGHSSATVTLDVYAHAFEGRKRDAVDAVPIPAAETAENARRARAEGETP
jgi:integrase